MGVRRLAVANGPNIFQMLLVIIVIVQVRVDVFLLESRGGRKAAVHADVRSTSGILHVAVEIRLNSIVTRFSSHLPLNTNH